MFQSVLLIILLSLTSLLEAAQPQDAIQRCLDIRRMADVNFKKKLAAKAPGVFRFKFHQVDPATLKLYQPQGDLEEIILALERQIENCKQKTIEAQRLTIAGKPFTRDQWCLATNTRMLQLAKAAKGNFAQYLNSIKREFDWYQSEGWPENHAGFKKHDFQFTAYYAPAAMKATSKPTGEYRYPFYRNPGVVSVTSERKKFNLKGALCGVDTLSKMERPYCLKKADGSYAVAPDRREIDQGALDPKYIIGYVKDPNDLAFLMVQGSGSVNLDGKRYRLNYDGTNGRPRVMLGRIIQCAEDPSCGGRLEAIKRCSEDPKCLDEEKIRCRVSKAIRVAASSEQRIRAYLDAPEHRSKAQDLRNRDQSYVFFIQEAGGPYGSENIPLSPHASCATDHSLIPLGMNFIYRHKASSWCVAQDSGGAIVGAHVDCYKGEGDKAGQEANALNQAGALFVLLPKKT